MATGQCTLACLPPRAGAAGRASRRYEESASSEYDSQASYVSSQCGVYRSPYVAGEPPVRSAAMINVPMSENTGDEPHRQQAGEGEGHGEAGVWHYDMGASRVAFETKITTDIGILLRICVFLLVSNCVTLTLFIVERHGIWLLVFFFGLSASMALRGVLRTRCIDSDRRDRRIREQMDAVVEAQETGVAPPGEEPSETSSPERKAIVMSAMVPIIVIGAIPLMYMNNCDANLAFVVLALQCATLFNILIANRIFELPSSTQRLSFQRRVYIQTKIKLSIVWTPVGFIALFFIHNSRFRETWTFAAGIAVILVFILSSWRDNGGPNREEMNALLHKRLFEEDWPPITEHGCACHRKEWREWEVREEKRRRKL